MSPAKTETNGSGGELGDFIAALGDLPRAILSGAEKAARAKSDPEELAVVSRFGAVLMNTMGETANLLRDAEKSAAKSQRDEANRMLRTLGASSLMKETLTAAGGLGSFAARLGLAQLVQLVKKLIVWVLELLGITGGWIKKLIDFIDEILDGLLGGGNSKATHALSVREQDYLNELTALARWENATARNREADDIDEEI